MFHAKNALPCRACDFPMLPLAIPLRAETDASLCHLEIGGAEVWDQPIADFEQQNPGVKVIREIGPQSSTQLHDLLTQKLKNRDPHLDVFVMDVIWPAEFASAGWTLAAGPFLSLAEQQRFLDAPIAANRYRGQIFGVPLFIDAGLLYYRKDLLAKYRVAPPRTWPELVDAAKKILTQENDPQLSATPANSSSMKAWSAT